MGLQLWCGLKCFDGRECANEVFLFRGLNFLVAANARMNTEFFAGRMIVGVSQAQPENEWNMIAVPTRVTRRGLGCKRIP